MPIWFPIAIIIEFFWFMVESKWMTIERRRFKINFPTLRPGF